MLQGSVKMENVIKDLEYWCLVSIVLSCVICVCLKHVGCRGDSVWVSQMVECGICRQRKNYSQYKQKRLGKEITSLPLR